MEPERPLPSAIAHETGPSRDGPQEGRPVLPRCVRRGRGLCSPRTACPHAVFEAPCRLRGTLTRSNEP
jgi:hypothetical protein